MKTKGKAWQLVLTVLLIAAFVYTAFFGVAVKYGDVTTTYIKGAKDIRFGVDIKGGVNVTFVPSDGYDATDDQLEAAQLVIENRLVALNVTDYELYVDNNSDSLILEFPSSLSYLGLENKVSRDPEDLRKADHIILPGVGAYGDAIAKLRGSGMAEPLLDEAKAGKPIMGICLGMQLLFDKSYEYGEHQGLGLIPGVMADLKEDIPANLKVPHMGWNSLHLTEKGKEHPLFKYSKEGDYVYFVHSFYGKDCDESLLATSEYGIPVTASAANENVMGCQFHPEKSGEVGLRILKAFSEI